MKHLLLYILLLIGTTVIAQPYDNITSDWCIMGLKDNVKEMHVIDSVPKKNGTYNIKKGYYIFSREGMVLQHRLSKNEKKWQLNIFQYVKNPDNSTLINFTSKTGRKSGIRDTFSNSYIRLKINDTAVGEYGYHYYYDSIKNGKRKTPFYIFNSQKKLIATPEHNKLMGEFQKIYEYDKNGHLTSIRPSVLPEKTISYKHIKQAIVTTDSSDNPTFLLVTEYYANKKKKSKEKITIRHISYTYYD